jgi:hypothetical protein
MLTQLSAWMDDRELLRLRSWKSKGEIYSDAVDDEESFLVGDLSDLC